MKRDVAIRGIPPRTMADVSRELMRGGPPGRTTVRHTRERFVNGVLEIVLPRKKIPVRPARRHTTPGR